MKIYTLIPLLLASLFFQVEAVVAQVTIGSGEKPAKGSVLDVKSQPVDAENITSTTGGIVMPRLQLQNINNMEPIIPVNDPDLDELKALNTGLIVYNLTSNASFKEGLYVWNGTQWEAVLADGAGSAPAVTAENGLTLTPGGDYIELGGSLLDANTTISQNNNVMLFTSTTGALSVNASDFIIKGGNTGIGKTPSLSQKLDISGDTRISGELTVEKVTGLKGVEIAGTASIPSHLVYTPNNKNKIDKFLVTSGGTGLARWSSIGGLSVLDTEPLPANTLRFSPADASSQNAYMNTGVKIELPPGKWLINYSVRMVTVNLNSASAAVIKPTSFRFTLLDNGIPIPAGTGVTKSYDDCRAYPDTYYNSLSGFFVLNNNSIDDKEYYLGIKTQELGLNWPAGNVELINNSKNDAYLIPIFMGY